MSAPVNFTAAKVWALAASIAAGGAGYAEIRMTAADAEATAEKAETQVADIKETVTRIDERTRVILERVTEEKK